MATLLEELIDQFKKATSDRRNSQKKWLEDNGLPNDDLSVALALAHNDMARRANGHTNKVKVKSVQLLHNRFTSNNPFALKSQADFDKWHNDTCTHMSAQTFPKKFKFTYGRAQKVLNMTFKYLYCTASYQAEVGKIDQFLHMTLDSYTLRWYKDQIVAPIKGLRAGDISNWSKMNESAPKHQYIDIQNRIRDFLRDPSITALYTAEMEEVGDTVITASTIGTSATTINWRKPFYAEFVIWQGEKIREKVKELISGLKKCDKTWSDDEWAVDSALIVNLKKALNDVLKNI